MAIKTYRPVTPTRRFTTSTVNDDLTTNRPHKPLTEPKQRIGGRRNSGDLTIWHRGGGHKRKLRVIDFKRDKFGIPAVGRLDRVRSQPLGAHCAAELRRWRKALHHLPGGIEGRRKDRQRPGGRHSGGQRSAVAQHSSWHDGAQHRVEAGQGRADGALGGSAGAVGREGRRLCAAEAAFRRNPQGAGGLHGDRRPGRQHSTTKTFPSARPAARAGWASVRSTAAWS